MLLSAAQIDHWVVMYDVQESESSANGWEKSSWLNDKEWLKKDFPLMNFPFLVDCVEHKVLSQTNAILSHMGRQLKMMGHTP